MGVGWYGKTAVARQAMVLLEQQRTFMNFPTLNNWGEVLNMSLFGLLHSIFYALLFRVNGSVATKREAVPFGEGEDRGPILLINLDDRETPSFPNPPSSSSFPPTQDPGRRDSSTWHLQVDCSNSLILELMVDCRRLQLAKGTAICLHHGSGSCKSTSSCSSFQCQLKALVFQWMY